MNKKLFKEIIVWSPMDEEKVRRYRIFEILPDKKYLVKAFDLFYLSHESVHFETLDFQPFQAVFRGDFEMNLKDKLYDSIEEAIESFEKEDL